MQSSALSGLSDIHWGVGTYSVFALARDSPGSPLKQVGVNSKILEL